MRMWSSVLTAGQEVKHEFGPYEHGWLQVVKGSLTVGDQRLDEGDGLQLSHETQLTIAARTDAEFLLFDLA